MFIDRVVYHRETDAGTLRIDDREGVFTLSWEPDGEPIKVLFNGPKDDFIRFLMVMAEPEIQRDL